MADYSSRYLPFLQRVLTPSRLKHSLGVMQVMGELAKIYALDEERALTAGLLHDAAKDLSIEQIEKIIVEAHIEFHDPCEHNYVLYLHGPVGAFYVSKELGITDPSILDAIYRHTWLEKSNLLNLRWYGVFGFQISLNQTAGGMARPKDTGK